MPKEWTDEEVQTLISDSVKIVAEDRERAQYQALHARFGTPEGDPNPDPGKNPPPKKDAPEGEPKKSKKSIWWGEVDDS